MLGIKTGTFLVFGFLFVVGGPSFTGMGISSTTRSFLPVFLWFEGPADEQASASSTCKTRFYGHLHTWSNHVTDHLLLGKLVSWSVGQSVSLSLCRCRCRTLGLQVCQAQFFVSRSFRPQFISGPIGITMSAMLFPGRSHQFINYLTE